MSIWELTVGEMMWHANDIFIKKYFNENRKQKGEKNPVGSDALLATKKYEYLLWSAAVYICVCVYLYCFPKTVFKEVPNFFVMGFK